MRSVAARYVTPDGAALWCEFSGDGPDTAVLADGLGRDGCPSKVVRRALARR